MKRYTLKLGVALAAVAAAGGGAAWAHDDASAGTAHSGVAPGTATDLSFQLAMAAYKGDSAATPAIPDADTSKAEVGKAEAGTADADTESDPVSGMDSGAASDTDGDPTPLDVPASPFAASVAASLIGVDAAAAQGTRKIVQEGTATTPGPDGLLLGGTYIESDNFRELDDKTVIAYGHVQMRYKGKTIFADQVSYNPTTQVTVATGHTVTVDADGSVQFADMATYDSNMTQGTSGNFADVGADQSRIAARRVDRVDANTNILYNTIYTPCQICTPKGANEAPTFSIASSKVTERKDKGMVYYDNALIRIKGIPFIYSPLLWTADPQNPRASGFMDPKIGESRARGETWEQPYLWIISPYDYLIVDPQLNTKVSPLLSLDFKRRFYSGDLEVRFGATYDKFFDGLGDDWGKSDLRDFYIANGAFKINNNWRWSFSAEGVHDPNNDINPATKLPYGPNANFFDRYSVIDVWSQHGEFTVDARELINQVNLTRQDPDSYFAINMADFQSQQIAGYEPLSSETTRPYAVSSDTFPIIAPMVEGYWSPHNNILGGDFTASINAIGLKNQIYPGANVAPAAADGTSAFDTARLTAMVSWTGDYVFGNTGLKGGPFFDYRHDYYHESDLTSTGLSADANRDLSTAGFNLSYPLIRRFKSVTVTITPQIQAAVSPKYVSNPDIPTEDSQSQEFDTTNLFSTDRSPGFDVYESGARLNTGVGASLLWDNGVKFNTLLGRVFRNQVQTQDLEPAFDINEATQTVTVPIDPSTGKIVQYDPYGLAYKESDWVLDSDFDAGRGFYGYERVRLDADSYRMRQGEFGMTVYSSATQATLRYIVNNTNPIVDPVTHRLLSTFGTDYRDISLYAQHFINSHWGVSTHLDRDLLLNKFERSTVGVIYKNECIWIEVAYERNDTIINTVNGKPQESFLIQIHPLIQGISRTTQFHDIR